MLCLREYFKGEALCDVTQCEELGLYVNWLNLPHPSLMSRLDITGTVLDSEWVVNHVRE